MSALHGHLERIRACLSARAVRLGPRVQSLWRGYGEVRRVHVEGGPAPTVIVKHVRPPPDAHPRKLRSYEVEAAFYTEHAERCGADCRVARCHGAWSEGGERVFVLEDLGHSGGGSVKGRLRWLAAFHATFLGVEPVGLWPIGTYWHLETRPDELARMRDGALKAEAPELDRRLRQARFQTWVHGDAKAPNFCQPAQGELAAVDFQYVGGGPGIRDVAYVIEGFGWPSLRKGALLDLYFAELKRRLPASAAEAVEQEWRALYPVAVRDFDRFLDGWR